MRRDCTGHNNINGTLSRDHGHLITRTMLIKKLYHGRDPVNALNWTKDELLPGVILTRSREIAIRKTMDSRLVDSLDGKSITTTILHLFRRTKTPHVVEYVSQRILQKCLPIPGGMIACFDHANDKALHDLIEAFICLRLSPNITKIKPKSINTITNKMIATLKSEQLFSRGNEQLLGYLHETMPKLILKYDLSNLTLTETLLNYAIRSTATYLTENRVMPGGYEPDRTVYPKQRTLYTKLHNGSLPGENSIPNYRPEKSLSEQWRQWYQSRYFKEDRFVRLKHRSLNPVAPQISPKPRRDLTLKSRTTPFERTNPTRGDVQTTTIVALPARPAPRLDEARARVAPRPYSLPKYRITSPARSQPPLHVRVAHNQLLRTLIPEHLTLSDINQAIIISGFDKQCFIPIARMWTELRPPLIILRGFLQNTVTPSDTKFLIEGIKWQPYLTKSGHTRKDLKVAFHAQNPNLKYNYGRNSVPAGFHPDIARIGSLCSHLLQEGPKDTYEPFFNSANLNLMKPNYQLPFHFDNERIIKHNLFASLSLGDDATFLVRHKNKEIEVTLRHGDLVFMDGRNDQHSAFSHGNRLNITFRQCSPYLRYGGDPWREPCSFDQRLVTGYPVDVSAEHKLPLNIRKSENAPSRTSRLSIAKPGSRASRQRKRTKSPEMGTRRTRNQRRVTNTQISQVQRSLRDAEPRPKSQRVRKRKGRHPTDINDVRPAQMRTREIRTGYVQEDLPKRRRHHSRRNESKRPAYENPATLPHSYGLTRAMIIHYYKDPEALTPPMSRELIQYLKDQKLTTVVTSYPALRNAFLTGDRTWVCPPLYFEYYLNDHIEKFEEEMETNPHLEDAINFLSSQLPTEVVNLIIPLKKRAQYFLANQPLDDYNRKFLKKSDNDCTYLRERREEAIVSYELNEMSKFQITWKDQLMLQFLNDIRLRKPQERVPPPTLLEILRFRGGHVPMPPRWAYWFYDEDCTIFNGNSTYGLPPKAWYDQVTAWMRAHTKKTGGNGYKFKTTFKPRMI